jgi:hypothetical protein
MDPNHEYPALCIECGKSLARSALGVYQATLHDVAFVQNFFWCQSCAPKKCKEYATSLVIIHEPWMMEKEKLK